MLMQHSVGAERLYEGCSEQVAALAPAASACITPSSTTSGAVLPTSSKVAMLRRMHAPGALTAAAVYAPSLDSYFALLHSTNSH